MHISLKTLFKIDKKQQQQKNQLTRLIMVQYMFVLV